eukprot:7019296-Prymnesium_polylepis.1
MPNASVIFGSSPPQAHGLRTRDACALFDASPTLSVALGKRVHRRRSASAALEGEFARLLLSRIDTTPSQLLLSRGHRTR